jgi:EAL domain-containing protein (putative c-di-GMP-specific phosphodiesterase class I)
VEINISVGISLIDGSDADVEGAMRRSDIAMYRAKQNSQDRIAIFDPDSDATNLDNYQLYVDLMQSIREGRFQILFQPIVDQHGHLHGLEALSRWHHPRLGIVGPDVFIDLAQRYRQIDQLSDELIDLSLDSFRELSSETPHLRLSLNLPPSKLSDPQLVERLVERLGVYGLQPSQLTIEFTERSVLMTNPVVSSNLCRIRDSGMSIALDDFGTGYSSLSLLSTLQPNEVKIDKSFVMAMQSDDYARQIVTLIADMAPRMNLIVVAEGVEDGVVKNLLAELGICYFQGFLFSKPLTVTELRQSRFLAST